MVLLHTPVGLGVTSLLLGAASIPLTLSDHTSRHDRDLAVATSSHGGMNVQTSLPGLDGAILTLE